MKFLLIPIHSQVDLITNSSSEIFVSTSKSSCTVLKKLITSLLVLGGSTKTCDDLFKIEVGEAYEDEKEWETVYLTKAEVSAFKKQGLLFPDDEEDDESDSVDDTDAGAEESKARYRKYTNEYGYEKSGIKVTALTEEGKDVANVLSALEDLFQIDAVNG